VAAHDQTLRASGSITASEVRRRCASSCKRIVDRGTIRNDADCDLINGIVVDLENGFSDKERASLQRLLESHEAAARRNL
jgi:hypothetical protein